MFEVIASLQQHLQCRTKQCMQGPGAEVRLAHTLWVLQGYLGCRLLGLHIVQKVY